MILELIEKAKEIGLLVVCVTSDMGSSNRALWAELGIASSRNSLVSWPIVQISTSFTL